MIGPTAEHPNPLANPANNWWQTRGPRTQAEADFLAGWKFRVVREIEAVMWLEEHAPDLVGQAFAAYRLPDVLASYRAQRDVALRIGRQFPDQDFSMEAVEIVRAARGDAITAADLEGRAAMLAAAEKGRFPLPEWRAWRARVKTLDVAASAVGGARASLCLRPEGPGAGPRSIRGSFAAEIGRDRFGEGPAPAGEKE